MNAKFLQLNKKRIRRSFTAACIGLAASLAALGSPASADTLQEATEQEATESMGLSIASDSSGTGSWNVADPICEEARAISGESGPCVATVVAGASGKMAAPPEQLVADGDLVSADGVKLSDVAANSSFTIWTRTWWQQRRGLYYINWWEKHTGRIYYHRGHVWSTTANHGYRGNHICDQGGGIGYDIRVTSCSTEVRGATKISEWDYFKVYVMFKGFPLSASHNMHINAYSSGNIYFH